MLTSLHNTVQVKTSALIWDNSNSKIQNDGATGLAATLYTMLIWLNPISNGDASSAKIFMLSETGEAVQWRMDGTNSWAFEQRTDADFPRWLGPTNIFGFNRWHCVAITFDSTDVVNNDPRFYHINTASNRLLMEEVTVTQTLTATGNPISANPGYNVGNAPGQTRTFDGQLAYLQYWGRILTLAELNQAALIPGSITSNLKLYLPLTHNGLDHGGGARHGTMSSMGPTAYGPPVYRRVSAPVFTPPVIPPSDGFTVWKGFDGIV